MLTAVDLNDQTLFAAKEIHDIRPKRHLPNELVPVQVPVAKLAPQTIFRFRL
jgi:hypothetical protein